MKKPEGDFVAKFGNTVRVLRAHKGMTNRGLAKIAGISIATLSAIETGKSCPDIITVNRVGKAFGLRAFFLCWLVEVDDPCSVACEPSPPAIKSDSEILIEFGERIRDIRLGHGLSLSQAYKAGAPTPSQLSSIERGESAFHCGVWYDWLMRTHSPSGFCCLDRTKAFRCSWRSSTGGVAMDDVGQEDASRAGMRVDICTHAKAVVADKSFWSLRTFVHT